MFAKRSAAKSPSLVIYLKYIYHHVRKSKTIARVTLLIITLLLSVASLVRPPPQKAASAKQYVTPLFLCPSRFRCESQLQRTHQRRHCVSTLTVWDGNMCPIAGPLLQAIRSQNFGPTPLGRWYHLILADDHRILNNSGCGVKWSFYDELIQTCGAKNMPLLCLLLG